MVMSELIKIDELEMLTNPNHIPAYIHKEHRYCLPLLFEHQSKGDIPTPCDLFLFDAHHDLALIHKELFEKVQEMRAKSFTAHELFTITKDLLRGDDSDWIRVGMELGLIKDVVVFGADVTNFSDWDESEESYTDHTGVEHFVKVLCCMPGKMLGFQGSLSDIAVREKLSGLWDVLGWEFIPKKGFQFKADREVFWLNIDLDCFAMSWKEFTFPWLDEVFECYFDKPSEYWSTEGWTGKRFFTELIKATRLITIAKEPLYCGGEENTEIIFSKINHRLFDDSLERNPL